MKGAGSYTLSKKLGRVYLYHRQEDGTEKTIMSVQIPPALGSNTSKTMTWHMTVTWETVVLSTHDHVVMCKPLSHFGEGVSMPVEVKPPSFDVNERTVSLKDAVLWCVIVGIFCFAICTGILVTNFADDILDGRHMTRAYPRCMRVGQSSHPGDVFCTGADNIVSGNHSLECTAFPHWLVRDQAWFDRGQSVADFDNLKLTLQSDGNLVLYDKETGMRALWASDTMGKRCTRVCYEGDDTFKLYCGSQQEHENVVISKRKIEEERKNRIPSGPEGPPGPPGPEGMCKQTCPSVTVGPPGPKQDENMPFLCTDKNRMDERCFGMPSDWDFDLDGPYNPKDQDGSPKKVMDKFWGDFIDHLPGTVTLENKMPLIQKLEEKLALLNRHQKCETFDKTGMRHGDVLSVNCGKLCDRTGCVVLTKHGQLHDTRSDEIGLPYTSPSTSYQLIFQEDGNLVLYNGFGDAKWASDTHGQKCTRVKKHGNVVSIECKDTIKNIYLSK